MPKQSKIPVTPPDKWGCRCYRCGKQYTRKSGFFYNCGNEMYRANEGYMEVCCHCVEEMFSALRAETGEEKAAAERLCMRLGVYWDDDVFQTALDTARRPSITMSEYLRRLNASKYKRELCYDDTVRKRDAKETRRVEKHDLEHDTIQYWGAGLPTAMYSALENRREYWTDRLGEDALSDAGTEALIRQVCILETQVNQDLAAGKSIDRTSTALNALIGSLNLKPVQKKDDAGKTPFGVTIKQWEDVICEPLPEISENQKDIDGIKKTAAVWIYGHLAHTMGIKNADCRLYEEEMAKYRVEKPEYADMSDDDIIYDLFGEDETE